jgi:hypothetical protein
LLGNILDYFIEKLGKCLAKNCETKNEWRKEE